MLIVEICEMIVKFGFGCVLSGVFTYADWLAYIESY